MKIKAIQTDLDGTIFNHDQTFSVKTIEALKLLKNKNYTLILNSGRVVQGLLKVLEKFNIKDCFDYLIGANGAEFYDIKNNIFKSISMLEIETIKDIYYKYKNEDFSLCVYDEIVYTNKITNFLNQKFRLRGMEVVEIDFDKINKKYPKVIAIFSSDKFDYVRQLLNNDNSKVYDAFMSSEVIAEFVAKGTNKLTGLDYLISNKIINYDYSEILSFGDSYNDKEMLRGTIGVSVGKNNDAVLSDCKYSTEKCEEDGFYNFIMKNVIKNG